MPSRAVFLDRDDTLIANRTLPAPDPSPPHWKPGDLADPARVTLLPGVLRACRRLHAAGFLLVAVSNQGTVARGGATLDDVHATNHRLMHLLTPSPNDGSGSGGGSSFITRPTTSSLLTAIYFCPFHPDGRVPEFTRDHPWRKPAPGMILAAARDLAIDLPRSWLVGDASRDVDAGIAAGIPPEHCIRIGEGQPSPDLPAAADRILAGIPR